MTNFTFYCGKNSGWMPFARASSRRSNCCWKRTAFSVSSRQGTGNRSFISFLHAYLTGITLVISPLLALMRDQIDQLTHRFNISAASINSDQTDDENDQARTKVAAGEIKILFTSPEQLDHIDRFAFLLKLPISLLVIDEAHCISTWGHDFRPSYRHILHFSQELKKEHPELKILGLTATADGRVEKDIAMQLSSDQEPCKYGARRWTAPIFIFQLCL